MRHHERTTHATINQKAELREREVERWREQWVFDRVSVCVVSLIVLWASSVCDGGRPS